MRTLFLVENTLRTLDPQLDLMGALTRKGARDLWCSMVRASPSDLSPCAPGPRSAAPVRRSPPILLRQAQSSDGRPGFSVPITVYSTPGKPPARTGNRLAWHW